MSDRGESDFSREELPEAKAKVPASEESEKTEEPEPVKNGWVGDSYYVDGKALTGLFADAAGKYYYADKKGVVRRAAGILKLDGKRYYITEGGALRTKSGLITLDGIRYGIRRTDGKQPAEILTGKSFRFKGKTYHSGSSGKVLTGIHKRGNAYYYSSKAGVVKVQKGFVTADGKRYRVRDGGRIITGQKFKAGKYSYIADAKGRIKTGLFRWKGVRYYASSKGALKKNAAFVKVGSSLYYVTKGGKIRTGKSFDVSGETYHAKKNGKILTGVHYWKKHYYYANRDGKIRTKKGMLTWKSNQYYCQSGGVLKTSDFLRLDGKYYYLGGNGAVVKEPFTFKNVRVKPNAKTGEISKKQYARIFPGPYDYEKYVLIDISDQKLYYYQDGIVKIKSDVVTGNVSAGNGTPTGTYHLLGKSRNVDLVGADYTSFVSYWMNFIGQSYGLHDASWRSSFGGSIYKNNGSHGCVNLPYSTAKKLYNTVPIGTVIVIRK